MKRLSHLIYFLSCILISGCSKLVEIPAPKTLISPSNVFASDASAQSALAGIYSNMLSDPFGFANSGTTIYAGLSSDELNNHSSDLNMQEFFQNNLTPHNSRIVQLWNNEYSLLYAVNAAWEGLNRSANLTPAVSRQLKGEVLFLRAFIHFYLINQFGSVPYTDTTDYAINSSSTRQPVTEVYERIVTDLIAARSLLSPQDISVEKKRPSIDAATALLARVYLYQENWMKAIEESSSLIRDASYTLENLSSVFLRSSRESIWQLPPVQASRNTNEGYYFINDEVPLYASITDECYNHFETGDQRKQQWIGTSTAEGMVYRFPSKYKVKESNEPEEYYIVFRLAEQYLIRAEAEAATDLLPEAYADLDTIRNRAGLSSLPIGDTNIFTKALMQERRSELFAEWGHRWFDLRRKKMIDSVMELAKPGWASTDALYPIPLVQIQNNPAFIQNTGY